MRINNNLMAMNTHRQLGINNAATSKSLEKLSSGFRINRAGDDAAGLAISEKMRAQVRGLNMASKNAQDDISLIQTAEGALTETHAILQRMRELAVQSANDTNVGVDRDKIQAEVDQLSREITRIAETTEFNTQKLLNGDKATNTAALTFHVGANQGQNVELTINNMDAKALKVTEGTYTDVTAGAGVKAKNITTGTLTMDVKVSAGSTTGVVVSVATTGAVKITLSLKTGAQTAQDALNALKGTDAEKYASFALQAKASTAMTATTGATLTAATFSDADSKTGAGIKVNTQVAADTAITVINNAINSVSEERSKLGAMQNRLEHTIKNLDTSAENLQASESRIRDVDMAKEMMEFTKQNILQQAATAMLAQANSLPQGILQLLR
ncbi:flagellin N-terminal helical domain-containing protein [Anaerosalibacter sp. Marseille-P3206]|uniref:flagellin N-terminal helical domain-containing protein n=1 Tax=Anaerosalibacter sp. Marseille-P3206 TaxID=1871005 RepID=UPI0009868A16|nr:flagellin [Anaerosalibacter sp. Marseille-P3206]